MKQTILNLLAGGDANSPASWRWSLGLLLLRLWAGGAMALAHGVPKINKLMAGGEIQFPDPLGIGATASLVCTILTEFVAGLMVAAGFLTRAATLALVFTFVVVVFVIKFGDGFKAMELGATYLAMYLILLCTGPGRWSVDRFLLKTPA